MVNTRGGKIKKTCFSQASDHHPGAVIGHNDDLLTEILIRLPVASVLRFKSVSKHWRWLLSDMNFTHRHDKLSKSPGFFADGIYVPFNPEDQSSPIFCGHIMQSCNGLLLCCSKDDDKYYVYNPTNKQFATIPSIRRSHVTSLAFHPIDCVHYKVVWVRWFNIDGFQIHIYSSDTRKWKSSIKCFYPDGCYIGNGVYMNGAVHWALSEHKLLYYNIEAEQMQSLPFPMEMMPYDTRIMYFGESRGHLHLVGTYYCKYNSLHMNVYEMLRDRSGWSVKYQVELVRLLGDFPEMVDSSDYNFDVLDVVRGEKEEDTFLVVRIPGKFLRYNLHHKSFEQILSFPNDKYDGRLTLHRYIETLSSF